LEDTHNCNHFTKDDIDKAFQILEKAQMIINKTNHPVLENSLPSKPTFTNQTPIIM